jgi:UDP-glucose 4-epimerase
MVSSTNPSSSVGSAVIDAQQNLMSSLELIEVLKGNQEVKLVFVSSGGAVYGHPLSLPITESHPTNPVSFYGVGKLAVDKYLHAYAVNSHLRYTTLRLSNPFGPHQVNTRGQGLIPTIIESALLGKKMTIWGDGNSTRDYVFVDDAAQAVLQTLLYSGDNKTFNIGSGVGTSILDLISHVERITGKRVPLEFEKSRVFDAPANVLDVSLAKDLLSWSPSTSLIDGLEKTIRWNQERLRS